MLQNLIITLTSLLALSAASPIPTVSTPLESKDIEKREPVGFLNSIDWKSAGMGAAAVGAAGAIYHFIKPKTSAAPAAPAAAPAAAAPAAASAAAPAAA